MKKMLLVAAAAAFLVSCKKDDEKENTFKGAVVQLHDGKAWSSVRLDKNGVPLQLAITVTEAALNSMPTEGDEGHNHSNNLVLPLHPKASTATPFKFVGLDWNPAGHPPDNIYTLPHFDFHFYMVTQAEVAATVDLAKMNIHPAPEYIPQNYIPTDPVPQMGLHWVDITSPELDPNSGQSFTQTFIYGSNNGKLTFYEPMITLDFLRNSGNFERSIPQPAKVQQTGYYPTKMRIVKQGSETSVILDGFVLKQAS